MFRLPMSAAKNSTKDGDQPTKGMSFCRGSAEDTGFYALEREDATMPLGV